MLRPLPLSDSIKITDWYFETGQRLHHLHQPRRFPPRSFLQRGGEEEGEEGEEQEEEEREEGGEEEGE